MNIEDEELQRVLDSKHLSASLHRYIKGNYGQAALATLEKGASATMRDEYGHSPLQNLNTYFNSSPDEKSKILYELKKRGATH